MCVCVYVYMNITWVHEVGHDAVKAIDCVYSLVDSCFALHVATLFLCNIHVPIYDVGCVGWPM